MQWVHNMYTLLDGTCLLRSRSTPRKMLGHYRPYRRSPTLPIKPATNILAASTVTSQHWADEGGCGWAAPFAAGDRCTHLKPDQPSCQCQPRPWGTTTLGRSQQSYLSTGAGCPVLQSRVYRLATCGWWRQTSAREVRLYFPQWHWRAACPLHPSSQVWYHSP